MGIDLLREFLGWCALVNMGISAWWFLFFWLAHDWMYQFHGRMFKISVETFDTIHYATMALFKIGIFLLNLVPYLVLRAIS